MDPRAVVQLLETALDHHRAKRLPQAEAGYREVLAMDPRNADALHLLGVLAAETGHVDVGVDLIRRAISILPRFPEFHRHLAEALLATGRYPDAAAAFVNATRLDPRDVVSLSGLGQALLELGQFDQSLEAFRRADEASNGDPRT